MASRRHSEFAKQNKTSTPPSPGLGRTPMPHLGAEGTENWTHKGGSNVFGKGKKGFKDIKIHPVSSN